MGLEIESQLFPHRMIVFAHLHLLVVGDRKTLADGFM
jgi:hypothetical protein